MIQLYPKGMNALPTERQYKYAHSIFIHNSTQTEGPQVLVNRRMNNQTMVYSHSSTKEMNSIYSQQPDHS